MSVQILKMINGEEIVGSVTKETDGAITVSKPAIVMLAPNGSGGVQVQMGPWCPHSDSDVELQKSHILYRLEPNTELLNGYNANFGSGLVVPPKKLITG